MTWPTREEQACTGAAMAKMQAVAASPIQPCLCHCPQLAPLQTQASKAVASTTQHWPLKIR